jgi:hypothetical protein
LQFGGDCVILIKTGLHDVIIIYTDFTLVGIWFNALARRLREISLPRRVKIFTGAFCVAKAHTPNCFYPFVFSADTIAIYNSPMSMAKQRVHFVMKGTTYDTAQSSTSRHS